MCFHNTYISHSILKPLCARITVCFQISNTEENEEERKKLRKKKKKKKKKTSKNNKNWLSRNMNFKHTPTSLLDEVHTGSERKKHLEIHEDDPLSRQGNS